MSVTLHGYLGGQKRSHNPFEHHYQFDQRRFCGGKFLFMCLSSRVSFKLVRRLLIGLPIATS